MNGKLPRATRQARHPWPGHSHLHLPLRSPSTVSGIVATALIHGATAFVTNDRRLRRLELALDMIVLDDFALPLNR